MTASSIRFHFTPFRAAGGNHAVITFRNNKLGYVIVTVALGECAEFHAKRIFGFSHDYVEITHVDD